MKKILYLVVAIAAVALFVPLKWLIGAAVVAWFLYKFVFGPRFREYIIEAWKGLFTLRLPTAVAALEKASGMEHSRPPPKRRLPTKVRAGRARKSKPA